MKNQQGNYKIFLQDRLKKKTGIYKSKRHEKLFYTDGL